MSIFHFLEEIIFCRTEKSGNKKAMKSCTETSVETKYIFTTFFVKIGKPLEILEKGSEKLHTSLHIFELCIEVCKKRFIKQIEPQIKTF
jgi:hypothetical protein